MVAAFGDKYHCEQQFSLMKNMKSRTGTCLTEGYLEQCMQFATMENILDAESLLT
jgi:hypothetical protein